MKIIRVGPAPISKNSYQLMVEELDRAFPNATYGTIVEDNYGKLWQRNTVTIGDCTYGDLSWFKLSWFETWQIRLQLGKK